MQFLHGMRGKIELIFTYYSNAPPIAQLPLRQSHKKTKDQLEPCIAEVITCHFKSCFALARAFTL
uniref:Putative ovule protein n=1 Tax=Solanum chacoense TaxID=4108 RepID=A0A0V0HDI6_SOLCH